GSPAKGAIEVIGEALHGGVIHLYIAGIHLQVVVPQGADSTKVNTLIANAINEATLPVIAAVNDKSVELTARWSGETGNEITILTNYHTGEQFPQGIDLKITKMSQGAGNPDLADAVVALGQDWY